MVSPLWRAASDGDLEKVQELLKEATSVDVEIKDHTGATPLIQSIRNGHVEVVRVLLDHGADPNNNSAQGRPDSYSEDGTILELLASARAKLENPAPQAAPAQSVPTNYITYGEQVSYAAYPQAYYPEGMVPAPYAPYQYMYRPDMMAPPPPPEQQQQPQLQQPSQSPVQRSENGSAGLPPPEIAKTIPCRFYPACRYGSQCLFAHPDTVPAAQPAPAQAPGPAYGYPMPPVAYSYASPPYDPSGMSYGPYYMTAGGMPGYPPMGPMASPPFPPAPGGPHQRSGSDVHSPLSASFSPVVNPVMNGMWQVGMPPPISPYAHPAMGQAVPMSPVEANHSLAGASPHPMAPPSPTNFYSPANDVTIPTAPAAHRRSFSTPRALDYNGQPEMPDGMPPTENHITTTYFRGSTRGRGGRRTSYLPGQRQPPSNVPCLFFPTGKCKNGDSCRFAHIMPGPDDPPPVHPRAARPRLPVNDLDKQASFPTIHEPPVATNGHAYPRNGSGNGSSPSSQGGGSFDKLRAVANGKHGAQTAGSSRSSSAAPINRQRIPNADDFPALGGAAAALNGVKPIVGPTAAQVLQAPAPAARSSSQARSGSESGSDKAAKPSDDVAEMTNKLESVKIDGMPSSLPRAPTPARESDAVFA
ncbi:hypothetical protein CALCODRAFT_485065 [Calocera cornea HHB12733]|uniref:C3H1-type domain-containing protein n=1 Tax=Calocera cornea HHB12733 TaxID=1353952 RepID=A0A165EJX1_9BASI|nr:hypothetical protein CALCODRAFT_485065 [Calocera cornea HHB12733]